MKSCADETTIEFAFSSLSAAAPAPIQDCILSNSWVGAREKEQARHGFGEACDVIVYSHEEGLTKPDPRIYRLACERLDVAPDEVVFLDDLRANVEAARALGMRGLLFTGDTIATIRELRALLDA